MKALTLVLVVSFVAVAGDVFAQATIAGTVFDASGARLAGVAVEASLAETRVVDVRSPAHRVSLTGEVVTSIPSARSYNALLALIPGIVTNVNDAVTGT